MPLALRQIHSRWLKSSGRVVAIRISRPRSGPTVGQLDNLIRAATLVRDAGDIAPFPFVKVAANLVIHILEIIQTARQNQDDFKELGQNLVDIIVTIRETLRSYYDGYEPPSSFTTNCQTFVEKLVKLTIQLNETVRKSQSWTSYFRSSAIRNTISQYRSQLDGLRQNFTLTALIHIGVKVYGEQSPRQLGYTWEFSRPLRFIDAMNIMIELPMDLCKTPTEFEDFLKFIFRKRRGRRYVERGDYILTNKEGGRSIDPTSWRSLVKAGTTITMDIILRSETHDVDNDSRQCPACANRATHASLGDELTCSSCGTVFRVNQGFLQEFESKSITANLGAKPPSNLHQETISQLKPGSESCAGDLESTDISFFRRFLVLLDEIRIVPEAKSLAELMQSDTTWDEVELPIPSPTDLPDIPSKYPVPPGSPKPRRPSTPPPSKPMRSVAAEKAELQPDTAWDEVGLPMQSPTGPPDIPSNYPTPPYSPPTTSPLSDQRSASVSSKASSPATPSPSRTYKPAPLSTSRTPALLRSQTPAFPQARSHTPSVRSQTPSIRTHYRAPSAMRTSTPVPPPIPPQPRRPSTPEPPDKMRSVAIEEPEVHMKPDSAWDEVGLPDLPYSSFAAYYSPPPTSPLSRFSSVHQRSTPMSSHASTAATPSPSRTYTPAPQTPASLRSHTSSILPQIPYTRTYTHAPPAMRTTTPASGLLQTQTPVPYPIPPKPRRLALRFGPAVPKVT